MEIYDLLKKNGLIDDSIIKNKIIFNIIFIAMSLVAIILVAIPSNIYGFSLLLLTPVGYLLRMFIDRPTIISGPIIAEKIRTIFVLLIIPAVLYLYVWEPAGWIFFCWMASYLLIRFDSGVHQQEVEWTQKWKRWDAAMEQNRGYRIKHNLFITFIMIILSAISLVAGYQFGGSSGLWIGVGIATVIWLLNKFAQNIVVEKSQDDETTKIE